MANKALELVLKIRAENSAELTRTIQSIRGMSVELRDGSGALATFEAASNKANSALRGIRSAGTEAAQGFNIAGSSMTGAVVKGELLVSAIKQVLSALKEATVGASLYAARTETLLVTTDTLSKVNRLNGDAVRYVVENVKTLGITTQEANSTIQTMIFAQLDLAKATDLARLSQNAAIIQGQNSSEALQGIIHGIVTRQPEVLRTYGIVVNFEQEFIKAARTLGHELSSNEKTQLAMNVVLREGAKITGAYEAAMGTAGKQLTSLKRYVDEAKNAVGKEFTPVVALAVGGLADLAKVVEQNAGLVSTLITGIAGLTAVFGTFAVGGVVSKLLTASGAATGLSTAWKVLHTSIVSNPVGLALLAAGAAIAITMKQIDDLKSKYDRLFDVDLEGAQKLEQALNKITAAMKEGKATADDFKKAIDEALDQARLDQKGLKGIVPQGFKTPDLKTDYQFREYVKKQFGMDPDSVAQLVEDGNNMAKTVVKAMTKAFVDEMKVVSPDTLGLKIILPKKPEELAAEAEALAKKVAKATKDVAELERNAVAQSVTGYARINVERQQAIEKLGLTKDLTERLNRTFDQMLVNERKETIAKILEVPPETIKGLTRVEEFLFVWDKLWNSKGKSDIKKYLQETNQLPDTRVKFGAEALEDANNLFKKTIDEAIKKDEEFLRESKKVVNAYTQMEEARLNNTLSATQSEAARAQRLIELSTNPGNEAAGNTAIAAIRKRVAQAEFKHAMDLAELRRREAEKVALTEQDLTAARLEYEAEQIKALGELREKNLNIEFDRTAEIMEMRKRELENFRDTAGKVFDSLDRDGAIGLKDFLMGYVKTVERQLFVNLAEEGFKTFRDKFKAGSMIPGQTNGAGELTLLGRILRGTPMGVDPVQLAQEANTKAVNENVAAIRELTAVMKGAMTGDLSGVGAGSLGLGSTGYGLPGLPGFGLPTFPSSGGSSKGGFLGGLSSVFGGGGLFAGFKGGDYSIALGGGRSTTASAMGLTSTAGRIGNIAGSAGIAGLGALGLFQGISSGNVGQSISAGLGLASMIPGPQQPFLMAGAAIAGFVSQFFGGRNKDKFDKEQNQLLASRKYTEPVAGSMDYDLATGSRTIDYDWRGRTRVIVQRSMTVQISALDARSIIDRGEDIAKAVAKQIDAGHDVNVSIQRTVFGSSV